MLWNWLCRVPFSFPTRSPINDKASKPSLKPTYNACTITKAEPNEYSNVEVVHLRQSPHRLPLLRNLIMLWNWLCRRVPFSFPTISQINTTMQKTSLKPASIAPAALATNVSSLKPHHLFSSRVFGPSLPFWNSHSWEAGSRWVRNVLIERYYWTRKQEGIVKLILTGYIFDNAFFH